MCIICVDIVKNNITTWEARRNLSEMIIGKEVDQEFQEHVDDVLDLIEKHELT